MSKDPQIELHKQWLGYLQPQGLVVAPAALVDCQAYLSQNVVAEQQRLQSLLVTKPVSATESKPGLTLSQLCLGLLGWERSDLIAGNTTGIESVLTEYQETLRPDYAVRDPEPQDAARPWNLLIRDLPHGTDPDENAEIEHDRQWRASHQARFERLLRESQVPAGLLHFGTGIRLVYAPKGESSGSLTFPLAAMTEVSGRPILAALLLLLGRDRMFTFGRAQRLPALLDKSRKFQNQVSTELAEQVLKALHELLRGFQSAHAHSGELLLKDWLRAHPDDIYGGLLTVILRLIFLLYAEDRGLLGNDEAWQSGYSVLSLFERLRSDADRFPDTMENRHGAWAQLLATFRLVFDGCKHGALQLPPRHGYLFHPDGSETTNYQFLEGRPFGVARQIDEVVTPPRVSDKVVWEVLQNLMVLGGERISYRTLNVEQIGSVYETMMGFRFEVTKGPSLAIKPQKAHGAATVVNLLELLDVPAGKRGAWLKETADCKVTGAAEDGLKAAAKVEDLAQALAKKVSKLLPGVLPAGSFVLQPSDARRKSGSHYTPPQLTRPIVETTLRPVLEQLGEKPKAEAVLGLKVCDPAMGSGAFLVEACRQLGAVVVKAWVDHPGSKPVIPPDEDELLFAKRLVATRCLYGVDKNPFAVALAKLSLWLETFAKEHAFTFVDHALRCGDSLVGLSKAQIAAFHWDVTKRGAFVETVLKKKLKEVEAIRSKILGADDGTKEGVLRRWLREADEALGELRLIGDLVVAAYFGEAKDKARLAKRAELAGRVDAWLRAGGGVTKEKEELRREVAELRGGARGVEPFHWEIEFPEVFGQGGFDAFVGNPPFAGKNSILGSNREGYVDWLKMVHAESHGNSDLVAHFFRRSFGLLRDGGTFGLIATNTIAQGDTRASGLRWICKNGGVIYGANRRTKWPGLAAVVVSVVHVAKGRYVGGRVLGGRVVEDITAFLFHEGGHEDPLPLRANAGKSFQGSIVLGMGFTFDDTNEDATPIAEMERLIAAYPKNRECIFPYLGGEEVNNSPTHAHHRYVINFGDMTEDTARKGWPELMRIVEHKVKPARMEDNRASYQRYWWQFAEKRSDMVAMTEGTRRILVINCGATPHMALALASSRQVFANTLGVIALQSYHSFAALQCRIHEAWARFFGSSMKDDLRYTPTDCFETFPFPKHFETDPRLEATGKAYYEFRADFMVRNNEGLTKTYNRFHDPDEQSPDIKRLRELHAAMDRAVLDAYGWIDLQPTHDFILDYEEDDDEEDSGRTRRRKKPYRYRWPDDFRDEVLARLLRLNQERSHEEMREAPPPKPKSPASKKDGRRRKGDTTPNLFGRED
jgi:hypothetical protein